MISMHRQGDRKNDENFCPLWFVCRPFQTEGQNESMDNDHRTLLLPVTPFLKRLSVTQYTIINRQTKNEFI